jgi:hypothetical protein
MIYCESCGNQLADTAKFCPECGTRVQPRPAPEQGDRTSRFGVEPRDLPVRRGIEPTDVPSRRAPEPPLATPEPTNPPSQNAPELPPAPESEDVPSRRAADPIDVPARSATTAQRPIYELSDLRPEQPPATIRQTHEVEAAPKPVVPSYTRIESGAQKILMGDPIFMGDAGFHLYLRELCGAMGYQQRPVLGAEQVGADFIFERDGKTMVMRVEVNAGSVGPGEEVVQKVREAQAHYRADEAVVATNRFFEDDAWEAARQTGVELWDVLGLRRRRNAVLANAL